MTLDPTLAGTTVRLSRDVYRNENLARTAAAALGLAEFRWYEGRSTQALSAEDDDHLYVAFRGTEANAIDWTTNSRFAPTPGELGGRVHSGFHDALDEVWPDVASEAEARGKPPVLTGHSLGGALATLAAARLHEAGSAPAGVYTYGQPRVGLRDFRAAYEQRLDVVTYRFINHIDLVTRVPLLIQGYRHVGHRAYRDGRGDVHIGASAWRIALDDVRFRLTHLGRIRAAGLAPHRMSAYVDFVDEV